MRFLLFALSALSASAATITFTPSTTTLPGGEIISIQNHAAPFQPTMFSIMPVFVPIRIDTTLHGSSTLGFDLPIHFSIDGGPEHVLTIGTTWIAGSPWRLTESGTFTEGTEVISSLGYPMSVGINGLANQFATGNPGGTVQGEVRLTAALMTPEPATFALVGIALAAIAAHRKLLTKW